MKMKKENLDVAIVTYSVRGGNGWSKVIGVFDSVDKLRIAIDNAFHDVCREYNITELDVKLHYEEGEEFFIEGDDFSIYSDVTTVGLNEENNK